MGSVAISFRYFAVELLLAHAGGGKDYASSLVQCNVEGIGVGFHIQSPFDLSIGVGDCSPTVCYTQKSVARTSSFGLSNDLVGW